VFPLWVGARGFESAPIRGNPLVASVVAGRERQEPSDLASEAKLITLLLKHIESSLITLVLGHPESWLVKLHAPSAAVRGDNDTCFK